MTYEPIPVQIMRLPLTSPCPVPVTADGRTLDDDGEVIPMEQRDELCAVDAGWMIGSQRICDVHLRECLDLLGDVDGGFAGVVREAYADYEPEKALERAMRPWNERKRYSQAETREWAESAHRHGLA